jgi:hypothetical protein
MAVIQAGFGRSSLRLQWLAKNTLRDKDKVDRAFLAELLASRGEAVE